MKGWNSVANEYSLHQVTQLSYTNGKNSSDSVLIINAMDILYGGNVECICIVSSDSDFTRLAMRIVEAGLEVIGMGEKKTAESFVNACTTFKFLKSAEVKKKPVRAGKKLAPVAPDAQTGGTPQKLSAAKLPREKGGLEAPKRVVKAIRNAILNLDPDADGWVKISLIGEMLHNRFPDFDPTIWGAKSKRLTDFLMQLDDFEIEGRESNRAGSLVYYIRIRK
jgi:Fe-S-cluster formation regulator IscX/YfhJ